MQISHTQIIFDWNQKSKQFYLTNNTQSTLIFKIKTTQLQLLTAHPSRGFLQKKQTKTIDIVCSKLQFKFQAKLQINYAQIQQKQKLNTFDSTWNKIGKNSFANNIILLQRKQNLQPIKQQLVESSNQKLNNKYQDSRSQKSISSYSNSFPEQSSMRNSNHTSLRQSKKQINKMIQSKQSKKTDEKMLRSITSPIKNYGSTINHNKQKQKRQTQKKMLIQTKIFQRQEQNDQYEVKLKRISQPNPSMNQTKHSNRSTFQKGNELLVSQSQNSMYFSSTQTLNPFQIREMNPSQLGQLCFVQSQLLVERQANQRLVLQKQQLRKNKQIERDRNDMMRQYHINNSMNQDCNHEIVNWPLMILISIIFFTIGVLVSKF